MKWKAPARRATARLYRRILSLLAGLSLPLAFFVLSLESAPLDNPPANKSATDAQPARPNNLHQWGAVTLFHGLPSDRVRAIAQTPDGVMWFGTDNGLARYDGRRTESVAASGLKNRRVLALEVNEDGTLWVGTEDGAVYFAGTEFRAIKETEGKTVNAVLTRERGHATLATSEGLLFDCRIQTDGSLSVKTSPREPLLAADETRRAPLLITSLASLRDNILLGTHTRGLLVLEGESVKAIESRPRAYFIQALERDTDGNLWMGTRARKEESGLYRATSADAAQPVRVGEGLGTVTALGADPETGGGMWVGTDGRGAYRLSRELSERTHFTFENTSGGLRSDIVYSIFVDRERVVWFGTDKGVCRFDPHALRVEQIADAPESNFVRALFRTRDGRVMCGTHRGLFVRAGEGPTWQPIEKFARSTVYAISEDPAGRLLVGTSGGLYASNVAAREVAADSEFTPVEGEAIEGATSDSLRALAEFRGATYAASYGRGLERVEGSRRVTVWPAAQASASEREVVSLYAEGGGPLWLGTAGGDVLRFDGREAKRVAGLESLKGAAAVWDIKGDADGLVWIATAKGLYRFARGELVNLLPGLDARSVLPLKKTSGEQAALCATAGGGIVKVVISESFGTLVSRQDVEQGLPSQNAFALLLLSEKSGEETLLAGTSRGLARYEAGQVAPRLAATRITSSRVHEPSELREPLRLEYPQSGLVVDVAAASSRTFPEQFQYAFLLYDHAGRVVQRKLSRESQFALSGLKPGNYRVEARAFNVDLAQSEPLLFEFSIAGSPFPWTTAALAVLLALALVALSWGYFQNRRIARTSGALMEANKSLADARLEVANQAERERRRIARDLHDQTLADLRNLILLTDQLPARAADNGHSPELNPSVFRAEIEAISTEIRRICEDLSPSVLENVGLSAALEWALSNAVAHAPADGRFEYEFKSAEDLDERVQLQPGERMQIYRIAQEAISNICRHAKATRVRLEVDMTEEDGFVLRLEDNGRDFDAGDKRREGRGLSNIRARAELIEALVSWTKRAEGGTLFTLQKPPRAPEPQQLQSNT